MMRRPSSLFTLCLIVILLATLAWADITGSVSGVVTDPNGAIIVGSKVTAINLRTGVQTSTASDGKGFYSLPALAVGEYDIIFSQQNFREFKETGVKIDVNSAVRIDVTMQLGSVSAEVSVKSDALQVETESSQMGMVIDSDQIVSMPLNGRSYLELLALQPGVSPITTYSSTNGYSASPGVSGDLNPGTESIDGGRPGANGFMVNGADAQEGVQSVAAMVPNLDSIEQFRIITNNFDAEYGNYSGGQVNVVTKSGTNGFHGDVFEFLRNTDLDARNYFSPIRGVFQQNQFGGTFGGPIKKNKLFFFVDYQGTRQNIGQTQFIPVPSSDDRNGNLLDQATLLEGSDPAQGGAGVVGPYWASLLSSRLGYTVTQGEPYYSAGCTSSAVCVFPNAVIPQSAWDPVAVHTLQYIPAANTSQGGQPYYATSAFPQTLNDDKGGLRIDDKTSFGSLFGYYFRDHYNYTNPYNSVNIPGWAQAFLGNTQMLNLGLTTTFGNSAVNDIRLVYLRDKLVGGKGVQGEGISLSSLGFNTPWNSTGGIGVIDPTQEGVPLIVLNNYAFGASAGAQFQTNGTYQIIDNVTKVIGRHSVQFGIDAHYDEIENLYPAGINNGFFDFNGGETGLDFADYLLGAVNGFYQAAQSRLDSRSKYVGLYAQDRWRATPSLTINYGLRYEYDTPWYDTQNKLTTIVPGEQSQSFPNAPLGVVVPGDPGIPKTISPTQNLHFAPRVGFAYAPNFSDGFLSKLFGGPGKSSIRAGYGLFYQSFADVETFSNSGSAPYGESWGSPVPPIFNSPFIDRATGHFEGIKFPFYFPPPNVSPSNPDTSYNWAQAEPLSNRWFYHKNVLPYTQDFELSLQRQIGSSTVVSVGYVGTVGRHLMTLEEANPGNQALCLQLNNPANVAPGTPTCGPFQENATYTTAGGQTIYGTRAPFGSTYFSSNTYMISAATSSYNSLQASIKHTDKYGNLLISYTHAKALGNSSDDFDNTNPLDPGLSRGLSLANVPNDLTLSYTVKLPFELLAHNRAVSPLVSGWALSGITTFASGPPVQIKETDDRSLVGANGTSIDEPSFASNGSPLFIDKNPRDGKAYVNYNFFAEEPLGQFGSSPPEFFAGPGINNFDMALMKDTKIGESKMVQFRAEAFNIFNHAQFQSQSVNGNYSSGAGTFGYVTGAANPRVMQVALKFLF
jgi:hypothetical protein